MNKTLYRVYDISIKTLQHVYVTCILLMGLALLELIMDDPRHFSRSAVGFLGKC